MKTQDGPRIPPSPKYSFQYGQSSKFIMYCREGSVALKFDIFPFVRNSTIREVSLRRFCLQSTGCLAMADRVGRDDTRVGRVGIQCLVRVLTYSLWLHWIPYYLPVAWHLGRISSPSMCLCDDGRYSPLFSFKWRLAEWMLFDFCWIFTQPNFDEIGYYQNSGWYLDYQSSKYQTPPPSPSN